MNDLGWALAGLGVRVAVLLAPALALQWWASRRGPGLGGAVAAWSLTLVAALDVAAFLPRPAPARAGRPAAVAPADIAAPGATSAARAKAGGRGLGLPDWRGIWTRVGERASGPARRARPWGWLVAAAALAGLGGGLGRLGLGMVAVGAWKRRGVRVDEPGLLALVEEVRRAAGYRRPVEVRVAAGLGTPAAAGWRRPVVLLPEDWRDWTDAERRAVVAHEVAHIARGDYAAGLLARVVVALNPFHPLVGWMARRLLLEQELAADALAARLAGGRPAYLAALASFALRQDGPPPTWPARAFLPARGALIRRIAMLKLESETTPAGPPRRLACAAGLLALAALAVTIEAPALADDAPAPAPSKAPAPPAAPSSEARPFDVGYLSEAAVEVFAFRPAAAFARPGMDSIAAFVRGEVDQAQAELADHLGIDRARPGFRRFDCSEVESVVVGFHLGKAGPNQTEPPSGKPLHSLIGDSLAVRMVAPFDWLALFRQWKVAVHEVRGERGVHYRIVFPEPDHNGVLLDALAYLPDDRTLVLGDEAVMAKVVGRADPAPPACLRGADWGRASRGLLAVAVDNAGDRFAGSYDLGRPDDAAVLPFFRGVDRWVLGLADGPTPDLHAEATARDPAAAATLARAITALAATGRAAVAGAAMDDATALLGRRFLDRLKVATVDRSVALDCVGFGTLAEVVVALPTVFDEANPPAGPPPAAKEH